MRTLGRVLVTALLLATGCKKKTPTTIAPTATVLAPLASIPTQALALSGHGAAVVDVPAGVKRPVPILVAVLGIGDTPEEQCAMWQELVGDRAFVVCPRGAPHYIQDDVDAGSDCPSTIAKNDESQETPSGSNEGDLPSETPVAPAPAPSARAEGKVHAVGFYPVDLASLDREVTAAIAGLKARFGAYVDDREPIYAGFSRGAFLGASLVAKHPDRFRRAILIEGGQSAWSAESTAAFAKGGGQRVLFACGQQSCVGESETAASLLKDRHVETRVVMGQEGHGYKKAVKDEIKRSLDWVTDGDARWRVD